MTSRPPRTDRADTARADTARADTGRSDPRPLDPRGLETRRLDPARAGDLDSAVSLLRAGRLVAVPTETVYGLAADARNPDAVRGIFAAKGRPADHPLIVHLPDATHLARWAVDIPDAAWRLAEAFWPGPLTLLLPKAPEVPGEVTGGRPSIGLRVPAHPVIRALLARLDSGLAAPSANPYQRLSPTTAGQVLAGLDGRIDAVLDGGPCEVGLESTIVDLTGHANGAPPRIVRAGPVTRAQLEAALGAPVEFPEHHAVAVPGNVAVHYRPGTPLRMFDAETLRARLATLASDARIALAHITRDLAPGPARDHMPDHARGPMHAPAPDQARDHDAAPAATRGVIAVLRLPADKAGFARALYAALHALDQAGADEIWLERPPEGEDWRDVHDRLARAASA